MKRERRGRGGRGGIPNKVVWETKIKRTRGLQLFHLLRSQGDVLEGFDVSLEVLDLSSSEDGEHIWCLMGEKKNKRKDH